MKGRVIVFGGSGFIGTAVCAHLANVGFEPLIVSRNKPKNVPHRWVKWNGEDLGNWRG